MGEAWKATKRVLFFLPPQNKSANHFCLLFPFCSAFYTFPLPSLSLEGFKPPNLFKGRGMEACVCYPVTAVCGVYHRFTCKQTSSCMQSLIKMYVRTCCLSVLQTQYRFVRSGYVGRLPQAVRSCGRYHEMTSSGCLISTVLPKPSVQSKNKSNVFFTRAVVGFLFILPQNIQ